MLHTVQAGKIASLAFVTKKMKRDIPEEGRMSFAFLTQTAKSEEKCP